MEKNFIAKVVLVTSTVVAMSLPAIAFAANISLNIKDSTGTDKFVVTDNGYVGMGTSAPATAIDVRGTDYATSQITSHFTGDVPGAAGGFIVRRNKLSTTNSGLPVLGDRLGYYLLGSSVPNIGDINSAGVGAYAESDWSSSSFSAYLTLETAVTSSGRTERVRITGSGNVGIGTTNPGIYRLYVSGGNAITTHDWLKISDKKLKKNVKGIDTALDKILGIEGVQYEFKRDEFPEKNLPEGKHYGVIAQQLETVLPEAVQIDSDGMRAVAYQEIIPVLVEAIKAQQKEIEELKKKVK